MPIAPPSSLTPSQIGAMGGLAPQGSPFGRSPLTGASWPAGARMFPTPAPSMGGAQPGSIIYGGGTGPGLTVDAHGNVTLPSGQTMTAAQYNAFGSNYNPGMADTVYNNPLTQGQSALGTWGSAGQWQPDNNPYAIQDWAKQLGVPQGNFVDPTLPPGSHSNISNGWSTSTPALGGGTPATSGAAASSGMMGTGGMAPGGATASGMLPSVGGAQASSGDAFGMGPSSYLSNPSAPSSFGQGSPPTTPFGILPGYGSQGMGGGFGPYQNFIPNANYNPGGGVSPSPIGGYWNQMAQGMAGPMFGPTGSSVTMGAANPQSPASPSQYTNPGAQGTNSSMAAYYPQFAQNGGSIGPGKGSGGSPMSAPGGSSGLSIIPPGVNPLSGGPYPYGGSPFSGGAFGGIQSFGAPSGTPIMYR